MFVGRQEEVDRLLELVEREAAVVVTGPAGIGKTALARATLATVRPFREAGALATLIWSPLLLYRRLLGTDLGDDPQQVAGAVLRVSPGSLLLDDLQWADEASLATTGLLVGRLPIVATVRSNDDRAPEVIDRLTWLGFETLQLDGLDDRAARELVDAVHPGLEPEVRDRLIANAGGNPLLLGQMSSGQPSPTLARALHARTEALSPAGRTAMERLSVLARPALPDLLGPGSEELVTSGLAHLDGDRVAVHHALLAEVVVADMGDRAAEVRRELVPDLGDLEAAHVLAELGDRGAAREAAARALAGAASDSERIAALRLLVSTEAGVAAGVEHRLTLAGLLVSTGGAEEVLDLCHLAPEVVEGLDRVDRGRLGMWAAGAAWTLGRPEQFAALIEPAVADLSGSRTIEEVWALAGSTMYDTRIGLDGGPAVERARRAVALAEEIGVGLGFAWSRLASVLLTTGDDGWLELFQRAIAQADREGDESVRSMALDSMVLGQWVAGDASAALEVAELAVGGRDTTGPPEPPAADPGEYWLVLASYTAMLQTLLGTDREAVVARWTPLLAEFPVFRTRAFAETAVGLALADLGRHQEAGALLDGSPSRAGTDPQWRSVAWWGIAEAAWLRGDPEAAIAAATDAAALPVENFPSAVQTRVVAAYAAIELGQALTGPDPVPAFPAWSAHVPEWRALRAWEDGRHRDAVDGFSEAAAMWEGHDVRCRVRCLWAAGEAARVGDLPGSVERLLEAERVGEAHQLRVLATWARRSLRAAGVSRSAARGAGAGGLTAREEEILDLVAGGQTSAEIGVALGIRPSSVDSAVRAAVRKLGATNRRNAVSVLRQIRATRGDATTLRRSGS